jgi:acetyl esterase/lipase
MSETIPAPDYADIPYGPHERNVLDFWRARGEGPAPLVVFIHGGGFRGGDKSRLQPTLLNACLEAGFALAAINYRLSDQASSPVFMLDGARAIQFLRFKATEWQIDRGRIAATGGSAGAGISLWVGFHDDLADASSPDPIARESTRLTCMAVFNGQCSYDPRFFVRHGIGPAAEHPFITPFYGIPREEFDTPEAHRLFEEAAAITYVSAGDPPVLMLYSQPDEPLPAGITARRNDPSEPGENPPPDPLAGRAVHHPIFGRVLKESLDALGIECTVRAGLGEWRGEYDAEIVAFCGKHF